MIIKSKSVFKIDIHLGSLLSLMLQRIRLSIIQSGIF